MSNFVLIAVCFLAGLALRTLQLLPADSHKGINAWIIYVALPAAALKYLPKINWDVQLLLPLLAPVIVWTGSWILTKLVSKHLGFDRHTEAGFLIVMGLGNTSFIGFPLISAYYGDQWISIASVSDQMTFVLLAVVASVVAMKTSGKGKTDFLSLTKKLLTFPPFLAIPVALLLPQVISFEPIEPVFTSLAATLSPLALFSVGLQFQIGNIRNDWKPITIAVGYKLILAPLIICLLAILLGISGMFAKLSVFEAAMGTMISAGILNNEFGLNQRLSNLIVFVGILLSFITSGIWYLVMERFFP